MSDMDLSDFIDLAGSVTERDRERFDPPADLWSKISQAVHDGPELAASPAESALLDDRMTDTDTTRHTAQVTASDAAPEGDVIDLHQARTELAPGARRMRRRRMMLGAVAAAVALIVGVSFFIGDSTPTYVAQTSNTDLPEAYDGRATATVVDGDEATLTLALTAPLPDDEPVEIWLIKSDFSDMRSLGLVEAGSDSFIVPGDLDLTEYSVVDLSIEPDDGDPTHSGRSILRGELQSV